MYSQQEKEILELADAMAASMASIGCPQSYECFIQSREHLKDVVHTLVAEKSVETQSS